MDKLILVIDDSPTIRKIIEVCLSREGFEGVRSFHDGIEAIKWMVETQLIPDLIILDLCLPKMDGFEVARRIKQKPQFRKTVIVILSRRDGLMDHLKGRLAGARTYLTKPFKAQDLVQVVTSHLGHPFPDYSL